MDKIRISQLKTVFDEISHFITSDDDKGFGRIRSKEDTALFGGHTTEDMKNRLGIKSNRPLADFLPTLTIAAKNLATEMTNYNVETKNLHGEQPITQEHIENNAGVREMLEKRGIKPENLPPDEDIKKLERSVAAEEKQQQTINTGNFKDRCYE